VGTAFTYQGRLTDGGSPANGEYDFRFELYDAVSGGSQVGSMVPKENTAVTDGLFTVELNFGSGVFNGDARYLEIGVRPGSGGTYTTLSPRQALTPAPYALALPGLWTQQNITSTNLIGGYSGNSVSAGVTGATIGGGGVSAYPNQVTANNATVAGGYGNTASGGTAAVGGGGRNIASSSRATVSGGHYNTASGERATVGGGYSNEASSGEATVAGGYNNTASSEHATVGGGYNNTAGAGNATVGGGAGNTASAGSATVPGGWDNTASGSYSFAAGRQAKANHQGAFVWGDSTDTDVVSTGNNQFNVRASGGVLFFSSGDLSTGAYLAPGSEMWTPISASDRNLKENFAPVDGQETLARLAEIPITTWNYKAGAPGARHMSPMAQDFYAAFGLGEDDKHLNALDTNGVALAAIQGLYAQNQALEAENVALQQQVNDLEARVAALETASAQPLQSGFLPGAGVLLAGLGLVWVIRQSGVLKPPEGGGR
jgi:hypothetical protein